MSRLAAYKATAAINDLVGNKADPNNIKGILKQITLIDHEIDEGTDNLPKLVEMPGILRDDIADILFTGYGLAHRLDFHGSFVDAVQSQIDALNVQLPFVVVSGDEAFGIADIMLTTMKDMISRLRDVYNLLEEPETFLETPVEVMGLTISLIAAAYSLGERLGYPVDVDYQVVVDSNMDKFDLTPEGAEATQKKYEAIGITTYNILSEADGVKYYITKSASDQTDVKGNRTPKDKWLKRNGWKEGVFSDWTPPVSV